MPLLIFALFFSQASLEARTVRVATFNIENGPDAPGTTDYNATRDIVRRINADIVAFQEIDRNKASNWQQMAAELGYTNVQLGTTNSGGGLLGYFSRWPLQATNLSSPASANEFTRRPMRAVVQVPAAVRPLVLWNMHHKADDFTPTNTPANQFRRAIEAHRIVQDINAYRSNNPTHTDLVMMGDLNENMFSTNTLGQIDTSAQVVEFSQADYNAFRGNTNVFASSYQLGSDIAFPVPYRSFPDGRYALAGLQRLNLRQQNGTWTGTRGGRYVALDYILLSAALTNGAVGEIYNSILEPAGLPKAGSALATNTSDLASDHFAVFADIQMQDAPTSVVVAPTDALLFSGVTGGPFTSSASTYTVSNVGAQSVSFTVSSDSSWLVPQITSGTVAAGATNRFSVSINAANAPTAPGEYTGRITLAGPAGTTPAVRSVRLTVLSAVTDHLAQQFSASKSFDLFHRSATFSPDGSANFYRGTIAQVSAFPVDPSGGTPVAQAAPFSVEVPVAGGKSIPFFGRNYTRFFIGSNGCITFERADLVRSPSLSEHFATPRISALFFDFDPVQGSVSYKQLSDRVAVTYQNVPQSSVGGLSNFQIEMFFDGRVRITWLTVAVVPGSLQGPVVGLSRGAGTPFQFTNSNFRIYPATPVESAFQSFVRSYGLDPAGPGARGQDPDKDSLDNFSEFSFGGSPVSGEPALLRARGAGGQVLFTFFGRADGVTYSVERASKLNGAFGPATGVILSNSVDQRGVPVGWQRRQFSVTPSASGFYRVRAVEN